MGYYRGYGYGIVGTGGSGRYDVGWMGMGGLVCTVNRNISRRRVTGEGQSRRFEDVSRYLVFSAYERIKTQLELDNRGFIFYNED